MDNNKCTVDHDHNSDTPSDGQIDQQYNGHDLNQSYCSTLEHDRLRQNPLSWSLWAVIHTLCMSGIIFGWASLVPILRTEGIFQVTYASSDGKGSSPENEISHAQSTSAYASVFTHAVVANYLSTIIFGFVLDRAGPKICGMIASVLFAMGLLSCSLATNDPRYLDVGFTLLGFAGPGIQMCTLHLARLFPIATTTLASKTADKAAIFMSAQAGAFDGGTMVFAIFHFLASNTNVTTRILFRIYLIFPLMSFWTAYRIWPNRILPETPLRAYTGAGSPYLSPSAYVASSSGESKNLTGGDVPLSQALSSPAFYSLAFFAAIHILKLNFVVATINDQLESLFPDDPSTVHNLIDVFGTILPFGFVVLPLVAFLLSHSTMWCFQIVNMIGFLYGAVLTFQPRQIWYQVLVVFTAVATSRQFVFSTLFHQTAVLFGFQNFGVILGFINVLVSAFSFLQIPLVEWAVQEKSFFSPNLVLFVLTIPLFGIVYGISNLSTYTIDTTTPRTVLLPGKRQASETTPLNVSERDVKAGRPHSLSDRLSVRGFTPSYDWPSNSMAVSNFRSTHSITRDIVSPRNVLPPGKYTESLSSSMSERNIHSLRPHSLSDRLSIRSFVPSNDWPKDSLSISPSPAMADTNDKSILKEEFFATDSEVILKTGQPLYSLSDQRLIHGRIPMNSWPKDSLEVHVAHAKRRSGSESTTSPESIVRKAKRLDPSTIV